MIQIFGRDKLATMAAFDDVAPALVFDHDIHLGVHAAPFIGEQAPEGVGIYNMEPLHDNCRSFSIGYLDVLRKCHVIDYSAANVAYLKSLGIEAFHMPYGWHPALRSQATKQDKDIDVLLIGSRNPRRAAIIEELSKSFHVVWVDSVYGKCRDELIARCRVNLNIHYEHDHQLEVVRLNYLLANGCNVVTEPGNEPDVNEQYEPLTYMSWDTQSAIEEAMKHPKGGDIAGMMQAMQHDCSAANQWLNSRTEGG